MTEEGEGEGEGEWKKSKGVFNRYVCNYSASFTQ